MRGVALKETRFCIESLDGLLRLCISSFGTSGDRLAIAKNDSGDVVNQSLHFTLYFDTFPFS